MIPLPPLLRRPLGWALMVTAISASGGIQAQTTPSGRTVLADVIALDQPIVYNRFGSHNPYGMMYALRRDVIDHDSGKPLAKMTDSEIATRSCRIRCTPGTRRSPPWLRAYMGPCTPIGATSLVVLTSTESVILYPLRPV